LPKSAFASIASSTCFRISGSGIVAVSKLEQRSAGSKILVRGRVTGEAVELQPALAASVAEHVHVLVEDVGRNSQM
jgi:hypothetical protein